MIAFPQPLPLHSSAAMDRHDIANDQISSRDCDNLAATYGGGGRRREIGKTIKSPRSARRSRSHPTPATGTSATMASTVSPINRYVGAAISNRATIRSLNGPNARFHRLRVEVVTSWFGPSRSRRCCASWLVNPTAATSS